MGWPAAPWSLAAAVRGSSTHVPVRSGAEELLASPLISRAEAAGPAARLTDRELGDRPRRWRLSLRPRQRRANQWPMDGTFFLICLSCIFFAR